GFVGSRVALEVVDEREMDDAVALVSAFAQGVEFLERPAVHFGTGRRERIGGRVGPRQTDDVMTGVDQFGHDGRADPTRCAGDEDTHEQTSETAVMSYADITVPCQRLTSKGILRPMGRWKPDGRGRLEQAAMELYVERGFENTTVAEIAERAGLSERTFFRHFSDKREVLFSGSAGLAELLTERVAAAPKTAAPLDIVSAALQAAGAVIQERGEWSKQRQAVIDANPELRERELIKLASLASA